MANTNTRIFPAFSCAVIFTLLFHRQDLGLNVFLIEFLILLWLSVSKGINFRLKNNLLFGSGLLLTSIAVVMVYSPFAIVINIVSFVLFIGVLIYPQAKSPITSLALAFLNIPAAQSSFFKDFSKRNQSSKRRKTHIFLIPLLIIFFFIVIYSGSSPFFSELLGNIGEFLNKYFLSFFDNIDLLIIFTFIFGMAISNFVFFRNAAPDLISDDQNSADGLERSKKKPMFPPKFKFTALKDELKAGIFLLAALNALLLVVNLLDIYWVWFNFSWNGEYLRQFVHEGTYLLLLSIVCSIVIVLYFFRGNLNFYSGNKTLRQLSYVWLAQNAILTLSVAMRNFHYVHYFALAYKRIALTFFLLLTLYGLYTVYIKVSQTKSSFFLFRRNALPFMWFWSSVRFLTGRISLQNTISAMPTSRTCIWIIWPIFPTNPWFISKNLPKNSRG